MANNTNLIKTLKELGFSQPKELSQNAEPYIFTVCQKKDKKKDKKNYIAVCYNRQNLDKMREAKILNFFVTTKNKKIPATISPKQFYTTDNYFIISYPMFTPLTLAQYRGDNYISITDGLKWTLTLSDALNNLHQRRLCHLSLAPNICFIDADSFKVEFLLLCTLSNFDHAIENHTPNKNLAYSSPEQCGLKSSFIDYRSDLYSLGIMLYELFTDKHPFDTKKTDDLAYLQKTSMPAKASMVNPRIPNMVSEIINKLIQKMASERYQNGLSLKNDLQRCLDEYQQNATIKDFELSSNETSLYLIPPNKKYGRDKEIKLINKIVKDHTNKGAFIFINGSSGIGKTTLLERVKKIADDKKFLCLSALGKYELSTKPYALFSNIFAQYINMKLKLSPAAQQKTKKQLCKLFGTNGYLVISIFPEFKQLVGDDFKEIVLDEKASRTQLVDALCKIIIHIAQENNGLVIFLDDLQWSNDTDLHVINSVSRCIQNRTLSIFFVMSYQNDKEFEKKTSPLFKSLNSHDFPFFNVELKDFNKKEVTEIISGALSLDEVTLRKLSHEVFSRTDGNPYFIFSYIKYLLEKQIIFFNPIKMKWDMAYDQFIKSKDIHTLVKTRIDKLPKETKEVLYYCSFFGGVAKQKTIAFLLAKKEEDILTSLLQAVNNDLIYLDKHNIHFKHDSILQYCTNMASHKKRERTGYEIGWKLYKADKKHENIFETVSFINKSRALCSEKEKILLHKLNLECAEKATSKNAFSLAFSLSKEAVNLLGKLKKQPTAKLSFETNYLYIKTSYLSNQYGIASKHAEKLLKSKLSLAQKIKLFTLVKDIYTNKGKQFSYIVSLGVSIAYEAGFKPPKDVNALTLENHNLIKSINEIYDLKGISAFKKIPKVKDSKTSLAFRLLMDLWEATYYAGDTQLMTYCALQITTQSLKKGYVPESAFGLVLLATVYVTHGKYSQAHDFGRLAMSLNSKFDDRILLPKVSNLFCNYINFFKEPFSSNLSLYEKSAEVARSNSDYLFGIWAVFFRIWSGILCGEPIRDSLAKLDEYRGFIRQTNDEKMQEACELLRSFLTSFQTTLQNQEGILDPNKHPTALLKSWETEGFKPGLTWYSIIKGQALFLNGDYQGALDVMHKYGRETSLEIVMFPVTQYHYIYALSILMLRGKAKGLGGTWRAKVMHHRSIIANWAKAAPINFNYQLFLIDALLAKTDKNYWQTHDYFQKAINAANESKSAINIALCNELAADFWQEQGDQTISRTFQQESYYAYSKWGAQRKLFQLENKSKNTKLFKHSRRIHDHGVEGEETATLSKLSIEDIPYLLKQIQTISIQTEGPLLYQTLLKFLIEQTGAQRALLIKDINRKSFIVCNAHGLPVESTSMNPPIPFDEYDQISKSLIIDLRKNGGVRLIKNAAKEEAYKNDPFIKENNIQSILALPIDPNKREAGIIYLENALVQDAFNDNHLKIAQILTSQALISLENSELYSNVLMQIKEREKVEAKLRVSEERMRHGIDLGGIGLWELDLETDDIYLPPETKGVFGFRDEDNEATYERFLGILHPDDKEEVDRVLTECKTGERKDFVVEYRIITHDGSTRIIEARGGVIKSSHDHVTRIIGVTQNKTKQRLMEEQIGHGKLMSSLEVLTGGIAHDFNNLLGVILGYGQVLKPALKDENQKQYLEHMIEAGNRGAVLTKRLLSLVGSETTEVKEYNINALLEASHDILRKTLTASSPLIYNLQPHKGFVQINQGDFNDVVLNLVVNSKLAMPKGGKVSISTFTTPTDGNIETINKQLVGEHVAVEFLDSGVGISPDVLPKIFEPFYSTRKEQGGTGLGLSQVYAFVQRSNGGITISSKPSAGTKITLYFPIAHKPPLNKSPKVNADESNTLAYINTEKILIVEDEESLGLLLSTMLKNLGYSTHWVNGPKDALTYLNDNNDIDIMITDLIMPGKLNGADLILAVQKKYPKIKCQLMSGYIHPDILKTLPTKIQKNILSKPFSQLELGKSLAGHKSSGRP